MTQFILCCLYFKLSEADAVQHFLLLLLYYRQYRSCSGGYKSINKTLYYWQNISQL